MKNRYIWSKFLPIAPMAALLFFTGWNPFGAKPQEQVLTGSEKPLQEVVGKQPDGSYLVPTGQTLTPAGQNFNFDGRPVDMALSPDGNTLAVMTPDGIRLFNPRSSQFLGKKHYGRHNFGGIVWAKDGRTLYSSSFITSSEGEQEGAIDVETLNPQGKLVGQKPILLAFKPLISPDKDANESGPCGMALSTDGATLFVSLFDNSSLAAINISSYNPATGNANYTQVPVGSSPEGVIAGRDGKVIYVADRGGRAPKPGDTMDIGDPVVVDPATYKAASGAISIVDASRATSDPAHAVIATIPVGVQPTALALSPNGKFLYAACSNNDSIAVIDTASNGVSETIAASPAPGNLGDSSPNGLEISKDGSSLFVSLGGDNAVEEITLDKSAGGQAATTEVAGLIPTQWFPINILFSHDGKSLYVANSKGVGSLGAPAPFHPLPGAAVPQAGPSGTLGRKGVVGHSVYNVQGSLEVVAIPDPATLAADTQQVKEDDHFEQMAAALAPMQDPFWSRFKHVIMIVKENRTYDQVFGDMHTPQGSPGGDPHLVMFGEHITPNHHALAKVFGLFDNLYCSGEISADGHHWVDEAFADDYDERALDRYPRSYPCCGTDPLSFAGTKFLWQAAMERGLSFRDYGEYGPLPSMYRHADKTYNANSPVNANRNEDVNHAYQFIDNVKKQGLAQLSYLWFPNDHTSGLRPGAYSPLSDVADNDMALGMLVSYISHNRKYWHDEPTCIFVVEDDAQGGLDHVDGHRTVGLVISPFNRRHQVNSSCYNQLTMDRTMELMLGMPPQNQFDAAAIPMRDVFQDKGDFSPYHLQRHQIALNLRNPQASALKGEARHWAQTASRLDFSVPDRADPDKVTAMLWFATHGKEPFPPPDAAR